MSSDHPKLMILDEPTERRQSYALPPEKEALMGALAAHLSNRYASANRGPLFSTGTAGGGGPFALESKRPMNRITRTDPTLDEMNDERAHLAIQISLLADADVPDPARLDALRLEMRNLELRISKHRPSDS